MCLICLNCLFLFFSFFIIVLRLFLTCPTIPFRNVLGCYIYRNTNLLVQKTSPLTSEYHCWRMRQIHWVSSGPKVLWSLILLRRRRKYSYSEWTRALTGFATFVQKPVVKCPVKSPFKRLGWAFAYGLNRRCTYLLKLRSWVGETLCQVCCQYFPPQVMLSDAFLSPCTSYCVYQLKRRTHSALKHVGFSCLFFFFFSCWRAPAVYVLCQFICRETRCRSGARWDWERRRLLCHE